MDDISAIYWKLSSSVATLSETLAGKTEELDILKGQMDNRNNSMTDTSPLRRIRGALNALREEIGSMELRIGVLRQSLLRATLRCVQHNRGSTDAPGGIHSHPIYSSSN